MKEFIYKIASSLFAISIIQCVAGFQVEEAVQHTQTEKYIAHLTGSDYVFGLYSVRDTSNLHSTKAYLAPLTGADNRKFIQKLEALSQLTFRERASVNYGEITEGFLEILNSGKLNRETIEAVLRYNHISEGSFGYYDYRSTTTYKAKGKWVQNENEPPLTTVLEVFALGVALANHPDIATNDVVTFGHDMRLSGADWALALKAGLYVGGVQPVYLGITTTGQQKISAVRQYAQYRQHATPNIDTARFKGHTIEITGSHTPKDYNGLKIMVMGQPLYGAELKKLYDALMRYKQGENSLNLVREHFDPRDFHADDKKIAHEETVFYKKYQNDVVDVFMRQSFGDAYINRFSDLPVDLLFDSKNAIDSETTIKLVTRYGAVEVDLDEIPLDENGDPVFDENNPQIVKFLQKIQDGHERHGNKTILWTVNKKPSSQETDIYPHGVPDPMKSQTFSDSIWLKKKIEGIRKKESLGMMMDGDRDRRSFFTSEGAAYQGIKMIIYMAESLPKGSTVVVDSRVHPLYVSILEKMGMVVKASPVGFVSIQDISRQDDVAAILAGEESAHGFYKVFFSDEIIKKMGFDRQLLKQAGVLNEVVDDAPVMMVLELVTLARTGKTPEIFLKEKLRESGYQLPFETPEFKIVFKGERQHAIKDAFERLVAEKYFSRYMHSFSTSEYEVSEENHYRMDLTGVKNFTALNKENEKIFKFYGWDGAIFETENMGKVVVRKSNTEPQIRLKYAYLRNGDGNIDRIVYLNHLIESLTITMNVASELNLTVNDFDVSGLIDEIISVYGFIIQTFNDTRTSLPVEGSKKWVGSAESYESNKPFIDLIVSSILENDLIGLDVKAIQDALTISGTPTDNDVVMQEISQSLSKGLQSFIAFKNQEFGRPRQYNLSVVTSI